ncbi:hypothetical protein OH687_29785 [Burkholderia anthina]|nr:hypothetical protein OH687_29785 [Burkholderia anthina]
MCRVDTPRRCDGRSVMSRFSAVSPSPREGALQNGGYVSARKTASRPLKSARGRSAHPGSGRQRIADTFR